MKRQVKPSRHIRHHVHQPPTDHISTQRFSQLPSRRSPSMMHRLPQLDVSLGRILRFLSPPNPRSIEPFVTSCRSCYLRPRRHECWRDWGEKSTQVCRRSLLSLDYEENLIVKQSSRPITETTDKNTTRCTYPLISSLPTTQSGCGS